MVDVLAMRGDETMDICAWENVNELLDHIQELINKDTKC